MSPENNQIENLSTFQGTERTLETFAFPKVTQVGLNYFVYSLLIVHMI